MMFAHVQRSSPTTATAIASATVTIQNVPNTIPPFASRGSTNQYQNQYQMNTQVEYRSDSRNKPYQMPQMYCGEMYNSEHSINEQQSYHQRQNHHNNLSRTSARNRQTFHQNYHNQQQYYYGKSGDESYAVTQSNYPGYQGEHPGYGHYNYAGSNVYPNETGEGSHMTSAVPVNHDTSNYYSSEGLQSIGKVQDYSNKVGYYDNGSYNSNHLPPNSDSAYTMAPEMFSGTNNSATGIMTPPASIHTDNSDNYTNFHQFYGGEQQAPVGHPREGSNSSSDFNFLSNLANDYTPEYYQI